MLIVFFRVLIIYALVVIVMRVMGKEEIGQLQPFEFVIALLIADLAAVPMQNPQVPLLYGIIPIVTLLILQYFLSYISLKSVRVREILCGKPTIVIRRGEILQEEMAKIRYNLDDLLEQLRIKGYYDICDIEYAILETKGELSVFPKSSRKPICKDDLQISSTERFPMTLIIDGTVLNENLKQINKDIQWLQEQLHNQKILNIKEVLYASVNSQGNFYTQKRIGGCS